MKGAIDMNKFKNAMVSAAAFAGLSLISSSVNPNLLALDGGAAPSQANVQSDLQTVDYLVPHISTVPANAGKRVELFVREKVQKPSTIQRPVVLMIHGATVSTVPVFDLQFEDYSWMERLANAGFDVFAMDHTGYGLSPRPMMDNPCNNATAQQQLYLVPKTLTQPCSPAYPYQLTSIRSDWDEIDSVVDYLRAFRSVDKVNLVAWSYGGVRAAGYAGLHPEKVERLFLYAPGTSGTTNYNRLNLDNSPQPQPLPGTPSNILGTNDFHAAWDAQVGCAQQYTPDVRPPITQSMLDFDPLGSTWGAAGVRRAPTLNMTTPNWGLNMALAAKITAPTLIIRGDLDKTVLLPGIQALFGDLVAAPQKVFVHVACASHYLVWEKQHEILLSASEEWLQKGTFTGQQSGSFAVDSGGQVRQDPFAVLPVASQLQYLACGTTPPAASCQVSVSVWNYYLVNRVSPGAKGIEIGDGTLMMTVQQYMAARTAAGL
ncbi:MAG: alpha/beta hydrolase [Acidobacteria bacterium]|nr:alpha/beta hydrolase [Acidobacteriota bacterium]